jgi:hypothetical protein
VSEHGRTDAAAGGTQIVRYDVIGTFVFVAAAAVGAVLKGERAGQWVIAVVSLALFAIGVVTSLAAYVRAVDRSRVHEIGVANLFLLSGSTAPPAVKRTLLVALAMQVVVAIGGASYGFVGLRDDDLNPLAFGILVPMFGIGLNGLWASRHGSFGPRLRPGMRGTDRSIG